MTLLADSKMRGLSISRCMCGAEMSLKKIERRAPHVEVQIFRCSRCPHELRVHVSADHDAKSCPVATGL